MTLISPTIPSNVVSKTRLRLICVGTGRDGTNSLAAMIGQLYAEAGRTDQVAHEYRSREFFEAFCNYRETDDPAFLDEIRELIASCPYTCIVGCGYASVLPYFAEVCGDELHLVHVVRTDSEACIRSLVQNCSMFPASYRYYSSSDQTMSKRYAAFHFGEMEPAAWYGLSLDKKLRWYFHKSHALVDQYVGLFRSSCRIATEELAAEPTRRMIARLVLGTEDILPPPMHLNRHFAIGGLSGGLADKLQWLMGRLDLFRAADEEVYAIDYFLNAFVSWTGYQIRRSAELGRAAHQTPETIFRGLDAARDIVHRRLSDIEELRGFAKATFGRSESGGLALIERPPEQRDGALTPIIVDSHHRNRASAFQPPVVGFDEASEGYWSAHGWTQHNRDGDGTWFREITDGESALFPVVLNSYVGHRTLFARIIDTTADNLWKELTVTARNVPSRRGRLGRRSGALIIQWEVVGADQLLRCTGLHRDDGALLIQWDVPGELIERAGGNLEFVFRKSATIRDVKLGFFDIGVISAHSGAALQATLGGQ